MLRFHKHVRKIDTLALFAVPIAIITLTDDVLAYVLPIAIEDAVGSNFVLGLILSFSSLAGFLADYIFAYLLKGISWKFQFVLTIIMAIMFPIVSALGITFSAIWLFFIVALIWGIYYELILFSQDDFIVEEESSKDNSKNWGILLSVKSVVYIIGPILGGLFLTMPIWDYTLILVGLLIFALIYTLMVFGVQFKETPRHLHSDANLVLEIKKPIKHLITKELFTEMKLWAEFSKEMFPVMLLTFVLTSVDMTIFALGGLFGEEIVGENSAFGWIVVLLYYIPMLLSSFIVVKLNLHKGKKKIAIISALIGGLILSIITFVAFNKMLVIIAIAFAGISISFSWPLVKAVQSDIAKRAGNLSSNVIGTYNAVGSLAGIIMPLLMGLLADNYGYYMTFSILGVFTVVASIVLLFITPRKIMLHHKVLAQINDAV